MVSSIKPCRVGFQPTAQWRPNITLYNKFKMRGHYTDDCKGVASEIQRPSQNIWIRAERTPPERITDEYRRPHRCVLLFLLSEDSTQLWLNSENTEVIQRNFLSDQTLWATYASQVECIESITPNFL